jgi:hypothetical protein
MFPPNDLTYYVTFSNLWVTYLSLSVFCIHGIHFGDCQVGPKGIYYLCSDSSFPCCLWQLPLAISYFLCVSCHPHHKVSIVDLDIYHGFVLCVLTLMFVFSGRLLFVVIISFAGSLSICFVNFFSLLLMVALLLLKFYFLNPLFLAALCLTISCLFLAILAMFNFSWRWYHSCFQVFVSLFCPP